MVRNVLLYDGNQLPSHDLIWKACLCRVRPLLLGHHVGYTHQVSGAAPVAKVVLARTAIPGEITGQEPDGGCLDFVRGGDNHRQQYSRHNEVAPHHLVLLEPTW